MQRNRSPAFSLIELSAVLVIIGLLVGGVFVGKSLVRSAELRSLVSDANTYVTAVGTFRNQYRGLPGDIVNAANYWSSAGNGNGDSQVTGAERFQFWYQLNQAGFSEKSATGTQGAGGSEDFVVGSNIPTSRVTGAGFAAAYSSLSATTTTYVANMGNAITFGGSLGINTGLPLGGVLTPTDALSIDSKLDDGNPGTGKWVASLAGGDVFGGANSCTLDASGSVTTGGYRLSIDTKVCSFYIATGF